MTFESWELIQSGTERSWICSSDHLWILLLSCCWRSKPRPCQTQSSINLHPRWTQRSDPSTLRPLLSQAAEAKTTTAAPSSIPVAADESAETIEASERERDRFWYYKGTRDIPFSCKCIYVVFERLQIPKNRYSLLYIIYIRVWYLMRTVVRSAQQTVAVI